MNRTMMRRVKVAGALLLTIGLGTVGSTVYAQEGSPVGTTAQTTQQDDGNDFPWGLLGLLGLGGLAGLTRRDRPAVIDASRASNTAR